MTRGLACISAQEIRFTDHASLKHIHRNSKSFKNHIPRAINLILNCSKNLLTFSYESIIFGDP